MKIETNENKPDVSTDDVIHFPRGLPGFADVTRYRLFHKHGDITVFWLEAEGDPGLQFSAVDPSQIRVQYQFSLSDEESEMLQLEDPEDISVLVLLYRDEGVPESAPGEQIRANLLGPIVINTNKRLGIQKVLGEVENFVTIQAK